MQLFDRPVFDGQRLMARIVTAFDLSDRRAAEHELAQRARQHAAVAHLGRFVLETRDLDALAAETAEVVRKALGVEQAEVLIGEAARDGSSEPSDVDHWLVRAASPGHEDDPGEGRLPSGISREAARTMNAIAQIECRGEPAGALVVMVLVKTALDLRAHLREHDREKPRQSEAAVH